LLARALRATCLPGAERPACAWLTAALRAPALLLQPKLCRCPIIGTLAPEPVVTTTTAKADAKAKN
jgi:hypothetical protein